MKLLVSIPSIKQPPFLELEKACQETWLNTNNPVIDYIFYYGSNEEKLENKELHLKCKDGLNEKKENNIIEKTIKMFEFALNNIDFDFMFRTNLSSYIDLNLFYSLVSKIEPSNCYKGFIGRHQGIAFASGAGMLMSKDVIKIILDQKEKLDKSLLDDVALAKLLNQNNIKATPLPRLDLSNLYEAINSNFHFRVKSNDPTRKTDCNNLRLIHKLKTK